MAKKAILTVQNTEISILSQKDQDYFSLTDIAKRVNERSDMVISNWLRNRNTIEFLGVWEQLNNPDFNPIEFDGIKSQAGLNSFILTVKQWQEQTGAIGLVAKTGRYGGTFAHKDIALEFCSWVSPTFKLYLIKEFERLKQKEAQENKEALEWNLKRTLAKVNYRIHTDAVKEHLVPPRIYNTKAEGLYFASEADLLNMALFGITASQWRQANPEAKGNMRDYATAEQLLVLANLENLNAEFIKQGLPQEERLTRLNEIAIHQIQLLISTNVLKSFKSDIEK
ncbi:MAG: KilA-N domain-containing protein [Saprospiraceae bacterium]